LLHDLFRSEREGREEEGEKKRGGGGSRTHHCPCSPFLRGEEGAVRAQRGRGGGWKKGKEVRGDLCPLFLFILRKKRIEGKKRKPVGQYIFQTLGGGKRGEKGNEGSAEPIT